MDAVMYDVYEPEAGPLADATLTQSERTWAMLIHLSGYAGYVLGPPAIFLTLILWLSKRDASGFIDDHGREAMNYSISIWLYSIIASVLIFVFIGCLILPVLLVFDLIIVLVAAVRASNGDYFRYPITIRLIR